MSNGIPETETMDRLFLELSQFTQAKTGRELKLERENKTQADKLAKVRKYLDGSDVERSHYLNLIAILENQS